VFVASAFASSTDGLDDGMEPARVDTVQAESGETRQAEPGEAEQSGTRETGPRESIEPVQVDTVTTEPIDSGFVFVSGRFVPSPYRVGRRGDDIVVNGRVVAEGWFAAHSSRPEKRPAMAPAQRPRGPRMGRRPGMFPRKRLSGPDGAGRSDGLSGPGGPGGRRGMGPWRRREGGEREKEGRARTLDQIEERLLAGGMLFCLDDNTVRFVDEESAIPVLDVLLGGDSLEDKLLLLSEQGVRGAHSSQWAKIVETFEPTTELMVRLGDVMERINHVAAENEAKHEQLMLAAVLRSKPMTYGMTIAAMGLAVVALGSLLSYRPESRARWRDFDTAGDGVPMVMRNVALLLFLGIFDLALTLAAQQTGGFLELNPLGSRLIESPWLLIAFKTVTLAGAAAILVSLRRYRGAQIASWWLCLVCTVLAFRWLTYNSMFTA